MSKKSHHQRWLEIRFEASEKVKSSTDRKGIFTFRGSRYVVHRLNNGEFIVFHGTNGRPQSLVRNPNPKLIEKAYKYWANADVHDVMDS